MNEESVFHLALEKSANERTAFLDAACAGNGELRQRVEALLRAHENPGSFLVNPHADLQATVAPDPVVPDANISDSRAEGPGTRIGPYKLLQRLGEGGMGVVYLAEQERPVKRRVAIKIIKAGMDSAQVIARFEQERQALAMMDHPNIARVLDAGTTAAGRPYFVMELVKGIPMTQYCDQVHLTPTERLQLFIPVCHAVQHAHQKGIIHRDLKPSNVLIALYDGKPVPKVIDFGVAKATNQKLTECTMFTEVGSIVGTLEYMAPEQAELNNLDIDTRADVYSLGVLLYELLTGSPPFTSTELRSAGFPEMLRMICEVEPPRPSTRLSSSKELPTIAASRKLEPRKLTQQVFGDLDWIVMKALEKDRGRRYETANGLAEDITRYLADDPVLAGPPSVAYRLRKFLKRNRGPVVAASVLILALVFGIAGTTWGLVRAMIAEGDALDARDDAILKERDAIDEKVRAAEARDDAEKERNKVTAANNQLKIVTDGLRRTLYASDLNLAQVAWEQNNMSGLRELIDGQRPERTGGIDLRGFEWHYLHRLGHAELDTHMLKGDFAIHRNFTYEFSPDGRRLAAMGGPINEVKIEVWEPATGKSLFVHQIKDRAVGPPYRCSFSRDGQWLAASGQSGWLKVFEVATGKELFSLPKNLGPIPALALRPDGKRVAAMISSEDRPGFVEGGGKVWDVDTGKEICSLPRHNHFWFGSLVYSPNGKQLAGLVADQTRDAKLNEMSVKVWDAATGKELFSLNKVPVFLFKLAFSPDGKRLAATYHQGPWSRALLKPDDVDNLKGPSANGVKIWEIATGKELFMERLTLEGGLSHYGSSGLAFSPDGDRLAAGSIDKSVKIWDLRTGNVRRILKGHAKSTPAVAFSGDGKHLYSMEDETGTLKVWDAEPDDAPILVKGGQRVVFSPTGTHVATIRDGMPPWTARTVASEVTVWDLAGKKLYSFSEQTGQELALDFSPLGERLVTLIGIPGPSALPPDVRQPAAATRELKVRDARSGNVLMTLRLHGSRTGVTGGLEGMAAFAPNGKRLILESPRPQTAVVDLHILDASSGKIVSTIPGGSDTVSHLGFCRDGTRFAAETWPGPVKVWSTDTGKELFDVALGDFPVFALSPDGRRLATRHENNVKIWDIDTRKELFTLKGHSQRVSCIAFSPHGRRIASATGMRAGYPGQGHYVKIWDAQTGQQLLTLKGHAGDIRQLMFTPDGNRLYSAGIAGDTWGDFEIRVWDATPK